MKKIYLPLVLGIILTELGLLVWLLAAIVPLSPESLYLQEDAAYRPFISNQDIGATQVVISQWLVFLLIAGFLVPVSGAMIGELIRWALDRRRTGPLAPQAKEE